MKRPILQNFLIFPFNILVNNSFKLFVIFFLLNEGVTAKDKRDLLFCKLETPTSKSFTYDLKDEREKGVVIGNLNLKLHKENDHLNLVIIKKKGDVPIFLKSLLTEGPINFKLERDFLLNCSYKNSIKVTPETNFDELRERFQFKVKQAMSFPSEQTEESQLMRTLFFQEGKVFLASSQLNEKMPWCFFRVQLKEKKEIQVDVGEFLLPVQYLKQSNNSYFTTYSFSFVDFVKAKKVQEKRHYSPFMVSCNWLSGAPFTVESFGFVVGKYLEVNSFP